MEPWRLTGMASASARTPSRGCCCWEGGTAIALDERGTGRRGRGRRAVARIIPGAWAMAAAVPASAVATAVAVVPAEGTAEEWGSDKGSGLGGACGGAAAEPAPAALSAAPVARRRRAGGGPIVAGAGGRRAGWGEAGGASDARGGDAAGKAGAAGVAEDRGGRSRPLTGCARRLPPPVEMSAPEKVLEEEARPLQWSGEGSDSASKRRDRRTARDRQCARNIKQQFAGMQEIGVALCVPLIAERVKGTCPDPAMRLLAPSASGAAVLWLPPRVRAGPSNAGPTTSRSVPPTPLHMRSECMRRLCAAHSRTRWPMPSLPLGSISKWWLQPTPARGLQTVLVREGRSRFRLHPLGLARQSSG